MMMGPNGPMPMPMPPPNHPIMMEMQALHQHLQGLYQQPQNPQTQQKVIFHLLHLLYQNHNYNSWRKKLIQSILFLQLLVT